MQIRKANYSFLALDAVIGLVFSCLVFGAVRMSWRWVGERYIDSPRILARAYPEAVRGLQYSAGGWAMILDSGERVLYSDGKSVPFEERMGDADLSSVLAQPYSFGPVSLPAMEGIDPGRVRNYPLLNAAYGKTKAEVMRNLETVHFLSVSVPFNRRNGAAAALRAVVQDIENDPELYRFMKPIADKREDGEPCITSWNWRVIAGTDFLSAHSYGIAIDILNPFDKKPTYWRWVKGGRSGHFSDAQALAVMPWPLVEVFEKHGFIWGGKWHHFDTMHFEYRPEFQQQARVKLVCHGKL
jgi:hypothetical protein